MPGNNSPELVVHMVVTVGGSLFSNLRNALGALEEVSTPQEIDDLEKAIKQLWTGEDIDGSKLRHTSRLFLNHGQRYLEEGKIRWRLLQGHHKNKQASAELQSTCQYLDQYSGQLKTIRLYLLATDTPLSETAGDIIARQLRDWYPQLLAEEESVLLIPIPHLKLDQLTEFNEKGLNNLLQEIYRIYAALKPGARLLINMTGGYKGTIPVLCLAAQLLGGQLLYSYEYQALPSSQQADTGIGEAYAMGPLLEIPSLDIHFFWDFLEACQPLLDRIAANEGNPESLLSAAEITGLEENLVPVGICESSHRHYQPTTLGKILGDLVEQRTPVGKSVLGYIIAFKVYEYLLEEPWKNYERVRQGYHFPALPEAPVRADFQFQDIDVLLGDTGEKWIWVEVKSYAKICFAYRRPNKGRYQVQLKNQMMAWQKRGLRPPQAYHLYIYRHSFHSLEQEYLVDNLQRIQFFLRKNDIEQFRVFYFTLDLNVSDWFLHKRNPYTAKLASRKLTRYESKYQRKLQSGNHFDQYLLVREYSVPIREP